MKKFLLLFFIFTSFIFASGCKDTQTRVFLSTRPIARETFVPMNEFKKNDTINFVLIYPKGFKSETVRLQLLKKSNMSAMYGYTLALGKDFNVIDPYYLTGAFTVYSGGRYELIFYDSDGTPPPKTHFPAKQYNPKPAPIADIEFGVFDD